MASKESLLELAERYLDENRFALARDAYRNALAQGESSRYSFANLSVAEESEIRVFLLELLSQRPEWGEARLALALAYERMRRPGPAIAQYNLILEKGLLRDTTRVRLGRYRAAVDALDVTLARDDFVSLWELGNSVETLLRLRAIIVKRLSEIGRVQGIDILHAIRDALPGEAALLAFLDAKEKELRSMESL
ncbi:hypothetical protein LZC95_46235 [Pendulispora brunnea]|uniref:ER membrane protein complex subunit 2 n=1 Tax=Pendulispora brunnea TaxID=2905690 RepID=A0ABZ2K561_9BACT